MTLFLMVILTGTLLFFLSMAVIERKAISEMVSKPVRPLLPAIFRYSAINQVPASIIIGVIMTESGGRDENKFGSAGELGIMQMKRTAFIDTVQRSDESFQDIPFEGLLDNEIAIKFGTRFLRILFDLNGNWNDAIRAYNCCGTNRQRVKNNPDLSLIYLERVKAHVERIGFFKQL